jgi:predicted Zn finger-like uncharacterized protein
MTMRIVCPACTASYDVPDAMLGAGRSVRCVRCLREWLPAPPAAAAVSDPLPEQRTSWREAGQPSPEAFAVAGDPDLGVEPDAGRPQRGASQGEASVATVASSPHQPAGPRSPNDAHAWRDVLLAPDAGTAAAGRGDGWLGWLASLVLLAALAWAAISYRGEVQRAWPPSMRLYAALGLYAPP